MSYEEEHYEKPKGLSKKGELVHLMNKDPTLKELVVAAGWDVKTLEGDPPDLDLSCFMLGLDGQTREDTDFVFYNNLKGCGGAVRHTGDSRTGAGDGDDETIYIDLNGMPFDVDQVLLVISVYDGDMKEQDLRMVRNAFIRVANYESGFELARYELDSEIEASRNGTAIIAAALVREGPRWIFKTVADILEGGLGAIARRHGIVITEETGFRTGT
jgi:tellurium resistance protein TerD